MISDKHYNSAIAMRLKNLVLSKDDTGLINYLNSLSNNNFRTAGYVLGERILTSVGMHDFFHYFSLLCKHNSKAFLGTLLKSVVSKLEKKSLILHNELFVNTLEELSDNPIDRQKTLNAILPSLNTPEEVEFMFNTLHLEDHSQRIAILLRCNTSSCYYILLKTLHFVEHDRSLLIRTTHYLMKKGDNKSFNMASILRCVYGLDEVKGTFSLRMHPYEISRVENNYDAFCTILK